MCAQCGAAGLHATGHCRPQPLPALLPSPCQQSGPALQSIMLMPLPECHPGAAVNLHPLSAPTQGLCILLDFPDQHRIARHSQRWQQQQATSQLSSTPASPE